MMNDLLINKHVCPVCGEELEAEDKFCPSCGAAVKDEIRSEEEPSLKENTSEEVSPGKNIVQKKKSGKVTKEEKEQTKIKSLPAVKLIYFVFGLVVVALLINIAAGVFDQPIPVASGVTSNSGSTDPHKGVDLQNLQQINSLEEQVKNNPGDKTSLLQLAHLLNDSGFKERAIEKYKDYLKTDPKDADVLVDMGVCYYELGKYSEAIQQMREAIKYQPKHQIAHLNLGIVNMTAGNHDEAIKWLKEAVAINPNNDIAKRAQELINSH